MLLQANHSVFVDLFILVYRVLFRVFVVALVGPLALRTIFTNFALSDLNGEEIGALHGDVDPCDRLKLVNYGEDMVSFHDPSFRISA